MDPNQPNQTTATAAGSAYLWTLPGKAVSVYIDFDVVDRLGFDIMRGFGAVPRRGAEVGGILLGSAEVGEQLVVRIEDFVAVPIEHLRGPSFIMSENDQKSFDETLSRWLPAPDKRIYAVGFYRSNTRDVLQLSPEDLTLLDARFAAATSVCLLVKPYATRVSEASFFLREGGAWPEGGATQIFPFRRKELGGGKPPRRPRGLEDAESEAAATGFAPAEAAPQPAPAAVEAPVSVTAAPESAQPVAESVVQHTEASNSKLRTGWVWIPLSFIFLLLGVVLGFQIALSYRGGKNAGPTADPYALELTAVQFGESLHLKWNPDAPAFKSAKHGMLYIQDGDNAKTVELKQDDLARGGVLYRNATGDVRFRMEVFPQERNSVSESLELHVLDTGTSAEAGTSEEDGAAKAKARRKAAAR